MRQTQEFVAGFLRLNTRPDFDLPDRAEILARLVDMRLPHKDYMRLASAIPLDYALGTYGDAFDGSGLGLVAYADIPLSYRRAARSLMPGVMDGEMFYAMGFSPTDTNNVFNPKVMTHTMASGIQAMDDVVFLVDHGVLPRPEAFFGRTNERMARFAISRAGFKGMQNRPFSNWTVFARFDDVKMALEAFSPDLRCRLARRSRLYSPSKPDA